MVDSKSDMDRIKQEFPQFNWLEKKYKDQNTTNDDKKDSNVIDISNIEKTLEVCNTNDVNPSDNTHQDVYRNPQETIRQTENPIPPETTQQYLLNTVVEGNEVPVLSNIEDNDHIDSSR